MAAANPANTAVAPNPPLDLPDYVRFSPKNPEVILLLKRFIRKEHMPNCAVKVLADSDLQGTVSSNLWTAADYPYFEEDEYWFFLHRKPAKKDKKNVDRRLGDLGTWRARGKSANIYIGAQLVGFRQKFELMKGTVKTGWSQFEYTRFSNKFEKICVTHLIFANKPELVYPSDISEEEAEETEEEEESADDEEQTLVNEQQQVLQVQAHVGELMNEQQEQVVNLEEEDAPADEEEQAFVNEQQVLAHEGELVNEQQVVNLEEAEEDAAADEEEQAFLNGQQVLAHEGEPVNEQQVVNLEEVADEEAQTFVNEQQGQFLDDDEEWTRFWNDYKDVLTVDDLLEDGDSEKMLEHVNEQLVVNLEEAAADEEGQTLVNEEQRFQVQAHEGELVNGEQGVQEPVVNLEEEAATDEDGEWSRLLVESLLEHDV